MVNGRTFKNLALGSSGYKEELVVRTKRDCGYCLSKVEMCDDHFFQHVNDQGESVYIDADQNGTIITQNELCNV